MLLVVDANVVYAALLRDAGTRRLILEGPHDLLAPQWIWEEVVAHRGDILRRSGTTPAALDDLLLRLQARILTVAPELALANYAEARARLHLNDAADAPYVAAAMSMGAALWTHDRRLGQLAGVRVVTTAELLSDRPA